MQDTKTISLTWKRAKNKPKRQTNIFEANKFLKFGPKLGNLANF